MTYVFRAPASPTPRALKPRSRTAPTSRPRRHDETLAPAGAERAALGIGAMLVSTALFPMSDMLAKTLTAGIPALEVAWMRYVVLVVVLAPVLLRRRNALATRRPGLQIARGAASAISTAIAILAFSFLPVADATAIGFVTPVFVTALAALVLKERVGWLRWAAACLGFCGILIMVRPGNAGFQPASLIPLIGAVFGAGNAIATRSLKSEPVETTLMISAGVGFLMLSCAMPTLWHRPDAWQIVVGIAMGLLAAVATVAQVLAYRYASASLVAPFSYSQLVWAGGLGWAVFGTVPGVSMLIGCGFIAIGGLMSAWRRKPRHSPTRDMPRALLAAPTRPALLTLASRPA